MNRDDNGGRPAEAVELDELWGRLESGLTAYLAGMVDPEEDDHLLLEMPGEDDTGCAPYAQVAGFDAGSMLRGEVAGNTYLAEKYQLTREQGAMLRALGWTCDRDGDGERLNWYVECAVADAPMLAHLTVCALRDVYAIVHPHLLTYRAWGPAAARAEILDLCASDEVPDEGREPSVGVVQLPVDRDELLGFVEAFLREKYEGEPTVDDDGDFVLTHLGQPVWVRVRPDQPAVEIMARVAHDLYSRRAAAVEIGLLNRDSLWVKWTMRERMVWQTIVVPGLPFVPAHLDAMLDLFLTVMSETRDDLAFRIRAKVA